MIIVLCVLFAQMCPRCWPYCKVGYCGILSIPTMAISAFKKDTFCMKLWSISSFEYYIRLSWAWKLLTIIYRSSTYKWRLEIWVLNFAEELGEAPALTPVRAPPKGLFKWNWLPVATFFESTAEVSKVQKRTAVVIESDLQWKSSLTSLYRISYFDNEALFSILILLKGFLVKQNGQWLLV
jgi:hypothetical protein